MKTRRYENTKQDVLRRDFSDRITGFTGFLDIFYPDYPVKKRKFLYYLFLSTIYMVTNENRANAIYFALRGVF